MKVTIAPSRGEGTVMAPPSKSMAHRALICGALAGNSTITRLAYSQDVKATVDCLRALGAEVSTEGDTAAVSPLCWKTIPEKAVLPCNESGSTMRFFLPLCMAAGKPVTLTGSQRLLERPLSVYEDIARQQDIELIRAQNQVTVCGRLRSGEYTVPGDISSQFITGLLFVLPLLEGDSTLTVSGRFESESYVNMTLSVLHTFGVDVTRRDNTFYIRGGQRYRSGAYAVEGDCSNAAFLEGLNVLGGHVEVKGLNSDTLQGDRVYREMFESLSAGKRQFDLSDCPDLGPVMFAMAAAKGGATFTGTARLRIKESDRSEAMAQELQKFGVAVDVAEDTVTVHGGVLTPPTVPLCGHNDHRIVMSLALLCTVTGGTITGAQAVAKSYPDFFEQLKSLQIGLELDET